MKIRMEHANLSVRDVEETIRFLKAAFPDSEIRHEGLNDGRRWVHIGTDDTYLALNEATGESGERWVPYSGKPGVNHLGFEVDDAEALRKRLLAAGFRDSTYPNNHPHRNRVYFYDADGNDWEFVEYSSALAEERNDYTLQD